MDEKIARPHRVPEYILRTIIERDRYLKEQPLAEAMANLAGRVTGTIINLDGDGKPDFLVQGDPGVNITGFWVFHNENGKWHLVLSARSLTLSINKKKTNGLRNISIAAASAVILWEVDYKFNSKRYFPATCWETGNGEKRTRIECADSDKPYR